MHPDYTPKDVARFWKKVDRSAGDDGCWLWLASRSKKGYGHIKWRGRTEAAHRVSYLIAHGALPDDLQVLHDCDNPPCVNPRHLFLGTNQDNVDDCIRKGRKRPPTNEAHWKHKVTDSQVAAIRERYAAGGVTYLELAIEHHLSKSQVGRIVRYQSRQPSV